MEAHTHQRRNTYPPISGQFIKAALSLREGLNPVVQYAQRQWFSYQRHGKESHMEAVDRPWKLHIALIVLWIIALWYGERAAFTQSMERCNWGSWEQWVR